MHFAVCTHTDAVVTYFPLKYIYLGPIYSTIKQLTEPNFYLPSID